MRSHWFIPALLWLSCVLTTGCMSLWKNETGENARRLGFNHPDQGQNKHSSRAENNAQDAPTESSANESSGSQRPRNSGEGTSTREPEGAAGQSFRESEARREDKAPSATAPRRLGSASAEQKTSYESTPPEALPSEQMAARTESLQYAEQEAALAEVVAELEAINEIDPETKRQLIADLRETKPALWQPMISIYRLALSSRKRAEAEAAEFDARAARRMAATPPEASIYESPPEAQVSVRGQHTTHGQHTAARAIADENSPAMAPSPNKLATRRSASLPSPLRPRQSEPAEVEPRVNEVIYPEEEVAEAEFVAEVDAPRRLKLRDSRVRPAALEPAETAPRRMASHRSTKQKKYAVRTASAETPEAQEVADWQAYLEESILLLEEGLPESARTVEEVRQQAELRLLCLAGGDREAALRPIDGISTTQQEFWSETIFALATYLDAEALPDGPRRAAEARRHLEAAVLKLGELSTLSVRNIAFCSKVNSYGIYETYPKNVFAPGQQVLLYTELENFKCENTPTGFITSVRSSYQIFDSRGVRVESHDFATTEETCRNRRRDFFMRYFIDLPTRIYDGEYTLKLTIEDLKGQTSGEAVIPFTIQEKK